MAESGCPISLPKPLRAELCGTLPGVGSPAIMVPGRPTYGRGESDHIRSSLFTLLGTTRAARSALMALASAALLPLLSEARATQYAT